MKLLTSLSLFLFITISLLATDTPIGVIETFEGETITMYQHPESRKLNFSKLPVGCDCSNQKFKLFFINEEGKLGKIAEREIKKMTLNKGAVYCKTFKQGSSAAGTDRSMSFEVPMEEDTEMRALPTTSRGKKLVLQTILAKNKKYTFSMFTNDSGAAFANVCSATTGKLIKSENFLSVGFSKSGKTFLQNLKKYFKDCEEFLDEIKKNEETNAAAKKRRNKIPYLQGVGASSCD